MERTHAARLDPDADDALAEAMRAAYDFDDLSSFLAQYYEGMSVLLTQDDFHALATAYFAKVASQGLVYVEMFFDPQAHTSRGVAFAAPLFRAENADAKLWNNPGSSPYHSRVFAAAHSSFPSV